MWRLLTGLVDFLRCLLQPRIVYTLKFSESVSPGSSHGHDYSRLWFHDINIDYVLMIQSQTRPILNFWPSWQLHFCSASVVLVLVPSRFFSAPEHAFLFRSFCKDILLVGASTQYNFSSFMSIFLSVFSMIIAFSHESLKTIECWGSRVTFDLSC